MKKSTKTTTTTLFFLCIFDVTPLRAGQTCTEQKIIEFSLKMAAGGYSEQELNDALFKRFRLSLQTIEKMNLGEKYPTCVYTIKHLLDKNNTQKKKQTRPHLTSIIKRIEKRIQEEGYLIPIPGCSRFDYASSSESETSTPTSQKYRTPKSQTNLEVLLDSSEESSIYDSSEDEKEEKPPIAADPDLLFFYAQEGNLEKLKELLARGVNICAKNKQGLGIREFAARGFMSGWDDKEKVYKQDPTISRKQNKKIYKKICNKMNNCSDVVKWHDQLKKIKWQNR